MGYLFRKHRRTVPIVYTQVQAYWGERMPGARTRTRRAAKRLKGARLRSKLKKGTGTVQVGEQVVAVFQDVLIETTVLTETDKKQGRSGTYCPERPERRRRPTLPLAQYHRRERA